MTRLKVVCNTKVPNGNYQSIIFSPVYSGSEENKRFFELTPGGTIQFWTINKSAADQFEIGKEYYVDFSAAE